MRKQLCFGALLALTAAGLYSYVRASSRYYEG